MNKLFLSFLILAFLFSIIDGIWQSGGIASTHLVNDITSIDTSIEVNSTDGFLDYGIIYIGDETIKYKSKDSDTFLKCERGYANTIASSYESGRSIQTESLAIVDSAIGFEVNSTNSSNGDINFITFGATLCTETIPRVVQWEYGWLDVAPFYYIKYLLYLFSGAFLFVLAYYMMTALSGIAGSFWRLITGGV